MKLKNHRGTSQIAWNIVEITDGATKADINPKRIILACGMDSPPLDVPIDDEPFQLEGLTHGKSVYDAVFVMNYHAGHGGFVERVNPDIPIYMNHETKSVLNIISDFTGSPPPRCSRLLSHGKQVVIGDGDLEILPLRVKYSAKGAMMILVKPSYRASEKILYTGDFSAVDDAYFPLIDKVDVLLIEAANIGSSNIRKLNSKSERGVAADAERIMRETEKPVFVLCSTTNIDRIKSIESACRKSGRTMAMDPFMKAITDEVAHMLIVDPVGFMPDNMNYTENPRTHKYLNTAYQNFEAVEAVSKMTNLVYMVRQTMGDFLKKLDKLSPLKGATLLYSMWDGYENDGHTKGFLDICRSLGMKIEDSNAGCHADRDLLEAIINGVNPETIVPLQTKSADDFTESGLGHVTTLSDREILEIFGSNQHERRDVYKVYES